MKRYCIVLSLLFVSHAHGMKNYKKLIVGVRKISQQQTGCLFYSNDTTKRQLKNLERTIQRFNSENKRLKKLEKQVIKKLELKDFLTYDDSINWPALYRWSEIVKSKVIASKDFSMILYQGYQDLLQKNQQQKKNCFQVNNLYCFLPILALSFQKYGQHADLTQVLNWMSNLFIHDNVLFPDLLKLSSFNYAVDVRVPLKLFYLVVAKNLDSKELAQEQQDFLYQVYEKVIE